LLSLDLTELMVAVVNNAMCSHLHRLEPRSESDWRLEGNSLIPGTIGKISF